MRAKWSTDGVPASAQRTAVDRGPCAAGRTGSVMVDVRVTPVTTRNRGPANGAATLFDAHYSDFAGNRNVMSTVVPVAAVSSSVEWLSALISGKPRPPLTGLVAGVFHEP